jgi:peptidase M28-like protein/PA domain-containing protein
MAHRLRLVGLLVAMAVALVATMNASAKRIDCSAQVNDTAATLLPCITKTDLYNHMQAFEKIAQNNLGPDGHPSRNSGEPGYRASVDYVANLMQKAGYNVTIQPYTIPYYAYKSIPTLSETSPTARTFVLNSDWTPGQSTGKTTSPIQPAGGIVIPPSTTSNSSSGCTSADFGGFLAGHIALIQRGTCNFGVKIQNAVAAGASGVLIFNEGQPGRTDTMGISIQDANGNSFIPTIPVAFTTFTLGQDLYNAYQAHQAPVLSFNIDAIVDPNRPDWNVIAESKGGDQNHVVVVDAHLDAIYGEGMLDNASGSATILDIAQQMKNVTPVNKLRFIWFGGEEIGLLGSQYYVNNLSSSALSHIGYDLDADVTATPNYTIGVLDPAAPDLFTNTVSSTFPNRVYKASTIARDAGIDYFNSINKNHELFSPVGTDAITFNNVGIPASGVLTGQDCCKTQAEVDLFGGHTGPFEGLGFSPAGCVDNPFLWCDNLFNNDFDVMTFMSKGFANMVLAMAFDTKVMSSSASVVYKKQLPISQAHARHSIGQ